MSLFQTRFATDADAESVARLVNAAFKVERFFIDRDRISAAKVRGMLQTGKFLLLEDGPAMLACVYIELRGERCYFGLLAVDPQLQGQGLGRRMVEESENYARDAGCRFMDLRIVNLRAELPSFYDRLGYIVTGTAPFAGDVEPNQPCHFINMSKPLADPKPRGSEPAAHIL